MPTALASTEAEFQVGEASVGSVELQTFPASSTTRQRVADGHDTLMRWAEPRPTGLLHVEPPSVELTALFPYSTATHDCVFGAHETAFRSLPLSATVVVHFSRPPVGSVDVTALPF